MDNFLFNSDSNGLNLIVKLPGQNCNIDCDYCFEIKKKGVGKKVVAPEDLRKVIENQEKKMTLTLHGGEPLMVGYDKFEEILSVLADYYPEKITIIRLQTNGTLFNKKWAEILFNKYNHLNIKIAVSLDGDIHHNKLRIDKKGSETYKSVINCLSLLSQYKKEFGILSVINRTTIKQPRKYIESLINLDGLKFIKLIPLFNIENGRLTSDSIKPTEFSKFVGELSRIYIENNYFTQIPIEPLLSIIQRINERESRYCNFQKSKCYNFITMYPENKFSPCDCFSYDDFKIENDKGVSFINNIERCSIEAQARLKSLMDECNICEIFDFCTGGCLANRFYLDENAILKQDYCHSRKMLFNLAQDFKIS
ncbi:radical SAM protein [Photobacterium damselae]|uniref:radical SAM protein n=1 Tax=Photobacterium damselae TaxID=38293 RepID=UPI003D7EEC45